jgi:hypothetical protein
MTLIRGLQLTTQIPFGHVITEGGGYGPRVTVLDGHGVGSRSNGRAVPGNVNSGLRNVVSNVSSRPRHTYICVNPLETELVQEQHLKLLTVVGSHAPCYFGVGGNFGWRVCLVMPVECVGVATALNCVGAVVSNCYGGRHSGKRVVGG